MVGVEMEVVDMEVPKREKTLNLSAGVPRRFIHSTGDVQRDERHSTNARSGGTTQRGRENR